MGDGLIEARTKVGKLIIDEEKLELRYTGIVGALNQHIFAPILGRIFNLDRIIPIKSIEKVTYTYGIPYVLKPSIVVYYMGKKRVIAFKHISQMLDYEGAKKEMNSILDYLRKLGVKVEEKNDVVVARR